MEDYQTTIIVENLSKTTKALLQRALVLGVFSVISLSFFFLLKIQEKQSEALWETLRCSDELLLSENPKSWVSNNSLKAAQIDYYTSDKRFSTRALTYTEVDDFEGDEDYYKETVDNIINSINLIIRDKCNLSEASKPETQNLNILGLEINGMIWDFFAPTLFMIVFINFCSQLRFRDELHRK